MTDEEEYQADACELQPPTMSPANPSDRTDSPDRPGQSTDSVNADVTDR